MKPIIFLIIIVFGANCSYAQTVDETYSKGVCEFMYRNYDKAFQQFQIAANQKHATAQRMVGCCYRFGYGVQKNLQQAKSWYKKAVDAGDEYAKECYQQLLEDEKYGVFYDGPNYIQPSGHSHCEDLPKPTLTADTPDEKQPEIITLDDISDMISNGEDVSGKTITAVNSITFDFGSDKIKSESYAYLDELLKVLKQAGAKIKVKGHTDNVGSETANLKLSQDRAKAVANYLVTHGVDKKMIQSEGFGSQIPLMPNDTEEGRAMNRRVEFEILDK